MIISGPCLPNVEFIARAGCAWLFQVWQDFHEQAKKEAILKYIYYFKLVQDHEQSCWEPQMCECFKRGKGFCSKNAIIFHKRSCGSFKYFNCEFTITSKKDLNSHMKAKHPSTKLLSKYHWSLMLLISRKYMLVHDCFECDKASGKNKKIKVNFMLMHSDLNLVHDL